MQVHKDELESSTKRSALNRFNPKRISFFGGLSSPSRTPSPKSSPRIVPTGHLPSIKADGQVRSPAPTKRKAASAVPYSPDPLAGPSFSSPFTNLSPFTSPPIPSTSQLSGRRLSGEARAIAANRSKAILSLEVAPGKRRKSVVDLEEATDNLRNTTLGRRRSSLTPIQPLAAGPRGSLSHFVPTHADVTEVQSPPLPSHRKTASGVRLTYPLPFPSTPRSPPLNAVTSPLLERRSAFADECCSPNLTSPAPPSCSSPRESSPRASTSSLYSVSTPTSRTPRSPRAFIFRDLEDDVDCAPSWRGHSRTASGVRLSFPLAFPSRPSRPVSLVDDGAASPTEDDEAHDFSDEEDAAVEETEDAPVFPFMRRCPPPKLSSASPFPPPFLSSTSRTNARESFSNFVFPSMPTLFAKTPDALPGRSRRISNTSSYESGGHGETVKTPSTLELHAKTPLGTGFSLYGGDPFAEAFAQFAGSPTNAVEQV
ncbi:hypothetical protein JCM10207_006655 [Rhodosporidiobolus poonsookiae]